MDQGRFYETGWKECHGLFTAHLFADGPVFGDEPPFIRFGLGE